MKKNFPNSWLKLLCIASGLVMGNYAFAEKTTPKCKTHQTPLSVFATNDMVFQNNDCRENDESYVLEYLQRNTEKLFLVKQTDNIGYDSSHVKAVSVFQPKSKSKPPVLIVLHEMENC